MTPYDTTGPFSSWLKSHGCSVHELWLLQNCLGTCLGFDHPLAREAAEAWEKRKGTDNLSPPSKRLDAIANDFALYCKEETRQLLLAEIKAKDAALERAAAEKEAYAEQKVTEALSKFIASGALNTVQAENMLNHLFPPSK